MHSFAEGTENLPAYSGKYSRADIDFDHDYCNGFGLVQTLTLDLGSSHN